MKNNDITTHQMSSLTAFEKMLEMIRAAPPRLRAFLEAFAKSLTFDCFITYNDPNYWFKPVIAAIDTGKENVNKTDPHYDGASQVVTRLNAHRYMYALYLLRILHLDLVSAEKVAQALSDEIDAMNPANHTVSSN